MKEYKIKEINCHHGLGEEFENLLNKMAEQGWAFKMIYRGEFLTIAEVIFERDKNI